MRQTNTFKSGKNQLTFKSNVFQRQKRLRMAQLKKTQINSLLGTPNYITEPQITPCITLHTLVASQTRDSLSSQHYGAN